uniref:Uncharacterized protein n=1 Tax=Corethron hystrix TaxID=216773 RepID=A0A7S1BBR8_9STRA|mmetsp:Transcript_19278/g.43902  ORF Transcript_19278/g.43902 Transcript_19278/m.43902 type:complete len:588 (+) Transcript_19278:137-1900(+)
MGKRPSGYAAKTEFNLDHRGNLINGRDEARVSLNSLKSNNNQYTDPNSDGYEIGGRFVKGGLETVPYNELLLRVGGGPQASGHDDDSDGENVPPFVPTYADGVGLPIGLFVRTASYGHLMAMLRARSRMLARLSNPDNGERDAGQRLKGLPLFFINPEEGATVLTLELQNELLHTVAKELNPFQNPSIATKVRDGRKEAMQQKLEELLDLNEIQGKQEDADGRDDEGGENKKMNVTSPRLTDEELARIAGGFGATDESVASLLMRALQHDEHDKVEAATTDLPNPEEPGHLQSVVNEGLTAAVRANDFHTGRQLLILYTLVASHGEKRKSLRTRKAGSEDGSAEDSQPTPIAPKNMEIPTPTPPPVGASEPPEAGPFSVGYDDGSSPLLLSPDAVHTHPPPPPLDTDRLRSATNSDGLLAVLGAAATLRSMQDGGARRRASEVVEAVEEWVAQGEKDVAFRVASWRDLRAAHHDLKIATDNKSSMMSFIGNKAILNRKKFAMHLQEVISTVDFGGFSFITEINGMLAAMNTPCLRLELLQYILGLDNRYSVAHVKRSVELAATCMQISANSTILETTEVEEGKDASS